MGSFLSGLFRKVAPVLGRIARSAPVRRGYEQLKSSAVSEAGSIVGNVLKGERFSDAARTSAKRARDKILSAVFKQDSNADELEPLISEETPPPKRKVKRSKVKLPTFRKGTTLFS